jgi:hypothetical protein
MTQRDRDPYYRERNEQGRKKPERNQRDEYDNWAEQVPRKGNRGAYEYGDFGWERGESVLPEFRDDSVHIQPYERQRVNRWGRTNWNREYDYGTRASGPYVGIGPKGYQRSDQRIFEDVCDRLTQHGYIDARGIQVNIKDGEVTLDGTVDSRKTKRMAEQVAENVRGVQDVHNNLRIQEQWNRDQSGMPGGGRGRVDEVGRTGVYPASGPMPPGNAQVKGEASWGQGDRGAAGYEDSGSSEIHIQGSDQEKNQS